MTVFGSKVSLKDFDATIGLDRGASRFKEILWYLIKVSFFLSALPYPNNFKVWLLRKFGAKVGQGVIVKPRVNIHFPWKLEIGNYVWIGEEAFLLNFENLIIGNNVCISQRSFLCGGNHDYRIASMPYRNGPITLKDGSWIGACCFIGPGVTIGEDTVITVGSVIVSDQENGMVVTRPPVAGVKNRWK
jgi:putative colanic acid biosynthesis acetyltransferase WcaF